MKFAHLLRSSHASNLLALFLTSLPVLLIAGFGSGPEMRLEMGMGVVVEGLIRPALTITSADEREFTVSKIVKNNRCEYPPPDGRAVGGPAEDYTDCRSVLRRSAFL